MPDEAPSRSEQVIHRPSLLVRRFQVCLRLLQVPSQHRQVRMPHQLLQAVDVHAGAEAGQREHVVDSLW